MFGRFCKHMRLWERQSKGLVPVLLEMLHLLRRKTCFIAQSLADSKINYGFLSTFGQPLRPLDHIDQLLSSVHAFQSRNTCQPLRPKMANLCVL